MGRLRALTMVICLLGVPWSAARAHLLNMTTVQVNVHSDGDVEVDLAIDLTRASGGSLDYFRLSRIARPLTVRETRALLDRLAAAVSIRRSTGKNSRCRSSAPSFPSFPRTSSSTL